MSCTGTALRGKRGRYRKVAEWGEKEWGRGKRVRFLCPA